MKKALIVFMAALTVGGAATVTTSAHCHGNRSTATTRTAATYATCYEEGCEYHGLHMHDGTTYRCQNYGEVGCGRTR